jgi:hypothetical protein
MWNDSPRQKRDDRGVGCSMPVQVLDQPVLIQPVLIQPVLSRPVFDLQDVAPERRFDLQPPAPWAPIALRATLGLAGTLLTTLALRSLTPPPF